MLYIFFSSVKKKPGKVWYSCTDINGAVSNANGAVS